MIDGCCLVCGNDNFVCILKKDEWSVYECTQCGLGVTSPFPDKAKRAALYDNTYFQPQNDFFNINSTEFKAKISQESHRIRFVKKVTGKGRLLDIGCGNGFFLYTAKQSGFSVEGLDISDTNKFFIEKTLGIPVTISAVEDIPYPENHFDVITMWHSLEHNPEPLGILKKCLSWLKSDGVLVIEVPNHNCIDARINNAEWPNWALPYHLYHFTRDSLFRLVESCGLKVIGINTYLSEHIKETLDQNILLKPFSRMVARNFDGGGVAIACQKK